MLNSLQNNQMRLLSSNQVQQRSYMIRFDADLDLTPCKGRAFNQSDEPRGLDFSIKCSFILHKKIEGTTDC